MMSKMTVDWYKDCLRNMKFYLKQNEQKLQKAQDDYERTKESIETLTRQIEYAEKKGLTEFDSDRLLKPRNKKTTE